MPLELYKGQERRLILDFKEVRFLMLVGLVSFF